MTVREMMVLIVLIFCCCAVMVFVLWHNVQLKKPAVVVECQCDGLVERVEDLEANQIRIIKNQGDCQLMEKFVEVK